MTTHSVAQPTVIAVGRITAGGPVVLRTVHDARHQELQDEMVYGRSIYVSGGTLEQCANAAQRAGFIGAESEDRLLRRRCLLALQDVLANWSAEQEWGL